RREPAAVPALAVADRCGAPRRRRPPSARPGPDRRAAAPRLDGARRAALADRPAPGARRRPARVAARRRRRHAAAAARGLGGALDPGGVSPTVTVAGLAWRLAAWDTPFWVHPNRAAGRFNPPATGPVQYWSLHPLTPWAE